MPKIIDLALAGANAAASLLLRSVLPYTLVCAQIGVAPALADSKSSAEFTLTTCLAAVDDLAKVEAIARGSNWTAKTSTINPAVSKFMSSLSAWDVIEGENRFTVLTWMSHIGENFPPMTVCSVTFRNNVNREEFFNSISASVELVLTVDTRFSQTGRQTQMYDIKSVRIAKDRTKLVLSIMSQSDGSLTSAIVQEMRVFAPPPSAPTYGRLGVRVQHVTEGIAASKKLKLARGALVTELNNTGAAKSAGIQVGDVIIAMDGKDIADMRDLARIVAEAPADARVDVAVIREGEEMIFRVTLAEAANARQAQFGTATEAKAMLVRAVAAVKADKVKALDMFAKGEGGFSDRDLYPFCFNISDGKINPFANPNGKQFFGMDIRDTGAPLGKEEYAAALKPEGQFTEFSYLFPKPGASAVPVPKLAIITRAGDLGCGVGYYK